jgi:hypothetical protein
VSPTSNKYRPYGALVGGVFVLLPYYRSYGAFSFIYVLALVDVFALVGV